MATAASAWQPSPMRTVFIGVLFCIGVVGSLATSANDESACSYYEHDAACDARCDDVIVELGAPAVYTPAPFGLCLARGDFEPRCGCFVSEPSADAPVVDGPRGDFLFDGPCPIRGRLGDCLDVAEADDCAVGEVDRCTAACERLDDARANDAATPFDTPPRLLDVSCDAGCTCFVDVDDQCVHVTIDADRNGLSAEAFAQRRVGDDCSP